MNKIVTDNYTLITDKVGIPKPLRILNLSDLHIDQDQYSTDLAIYILKMLEKYLESEEI